MRARELSVISFTNGGIYLELITDWLREWLNITGLSFDNPVPLMGKMFLGREGGGNLIEQKLGGPGKKRRKLFEISNPEIAAKCIEF